MSKGKAWKDVVAMARKAKTAAKSCPNGRKKCGCCTKAETVAYKTNKAKGAN
jgi:hypothetical protein